MKTVRRGKVNYRFARRAPPFLDETFFSSARVPKLYLRVNNEPFLCADGGVKPHGWRSAEVHLYIAPMQSSNLEYGIDELSTTILDETLEQAR